MTSFKNYFENFQAEKSEQPDRINALLDAEYVSFDRENMTAVLEFPVKTWELNRVGILHGGLISTMLDHACGVCVASLMSTWCPTVELAVKFLRPGQPGDTIVATSHITYKGRRIIHVEATLRGKAKGELLASCTSTYLNYGEE